MDAEDGIPQCLDQLATANVEDSGGTHRARIHDFGVRVKACRKGEKQRSGMIAYISGADSTQAGRMK